MVGTEKTSHIEINLGPHGLGNIVLVFEYFIFYTSTNKLKLIWFKLGDPDDKSLRKVETEILIPKKMRDKAKAENCLSEVTGNYWKCN